MIALSTIVDTMTRSSRKLTGASMPSMKLSRP
jgi:hypothetical protein